MGASHCTNDARYGLDRSKISTQASVSCWPFKVPHGEPKKNEGLSPAEMVTWGFTCKNEWGFTWFHHFHLEFEWVWMSWTWFKWFNSCLFFAANMQFQPSKGSTQRGGASQNEAGWGLDGDVQFAQFVPSYIDFTTTSSRNPVCDWFYFEWYRFKKQAFFVVRWDTAKLSTATIYFKSKMNTK